MDVLTFRKAKILLELYNNPLLPQYKLAKRLDTTPRIISRELNELQNKFAFITVNYNDPHKFKLSHLIVVFNTKSIKSSMKLDERIRRHKPLFLRGLSFDLDYRHGLLLYLVPNQPRGHRMFDERIKELNDEFFSESFVLRRFGVHQYVSFATYSPTSGKWMLDTEMVPNAMFQFVKNSHG